MFTISGEDTKTKARIGVFKTSHNEVQTPAFFPVATQAAVKGLSTRELDDIGINGILVNAYHLFLRPGVELIKQHGGLHKFMNFNGSIITDSGGYQIFSLHGLRKVSDKGVDFQSHIDGDRFFLTPEDVIQIQLDIRPDVIVPLDECIKYPADYDEAKRAAERTILWLKRSKDYLEKNNKDGLLFFGIIQGSVYPELRKYCLDEIQKLGVDGLCLGGLSVGEPDDLRYNMLSFIEEQADENYLRYFMGYGRPHDILEAVSRGIDLFDCIVPTRYARTGTAYTSEGKMVIRNAPFTADQRPLDETCSCYVCRNFTRAYLRHLINAREMLGTQLLTYHNVFWYNNLMQKVRESIKQGTFSEFKQEFLAGFKEE